ncbi:MAG: DUF169 domain-containing protein [Thermoleophilia bacterium]|nr:DUF169 domain-containing protein [Thermoleophilia bacterium]
MIDLDTMHQDAEELEKYLRLQTYPLAIRLLRSESEIPVDARRPKRDEGCQYNVCQAFALSRRNGCTMAMLKEDMYCFEPVVGYGMGEPPQEFLDGQNRYPGDVATQEAGRRYAEQFPRLETGKYIGILSAPLAQASFEPDAVMIYCNPAQLVVLLMAGEYKTGENLPTALSGHAACVYGLVPAFCEGKYQVAVPCRGDHITAMAGDDEMIFTIPMTKFDEFMFGMRTVVGGEGKLTRLPMIHEMKPAAVQPESYFRMAELMGMDIRRPD